jgi:Dolichyl-phosphate-mannose-protein mannosyltransferase
MMNARSAAQPVRHLQERTWPQLTAVVVGAALLNGLLAVPIRRPRIFGDELIYWQLSRAFAWTGHFTARGAPAPRYGVIYPALLAAAQRIGDDQTTAYAIAQGLNAVMFSLAAVPAYLIASRVLRRRHALLAALLAVVLPSSIYTSAIFTENAFYPLFLTSVLLMLRALERPSASRQLLVAASVAATFLVRAQAVVLLPSYLLAAVVSVVLTTQGRRRSAPAAAVRQLAPTIALLAVAGLAAAAIPGRSTLGPYHVLVTSYGLRPLAHWGLANVADLELYLGVVPLAAFGILLVQALSSARLPPQLRSLVILTACLGVGLLATVAALSASPYGLGRVHERNLFYLVPLVLISFFAWLDAGLPRPRRTTTVVAVAVVLLPLTIPVTAVERSGEDGIALVLWADMKIRPAVAIAGMVLVAAIAVALFLRSRHPKVLLGVCLAALAAATVAGEVHAVDSLGFREPWRDFGWIDRAVGPDARVVALWASKSQREYWRIEGLWSDEFFNRSVRGVASADGPLPDGLPIQELTIRPNGCLEAAFSSVPQYAVVATERRLTAPVVRVSPSKRAILYRLDSRAFDQRCFARLRTAD